MTGTFVQKGATFLFCYLNKPKTMKPQNCFSLQALGITVLLVFVVLFMGCSQPSSTSPSAAPAATQAASVPAAPTMVPSMTVNLSSGVTISVPGDWVRQDVQPTGLPDYGRATTHLANFVSPTVIPGDSTSFNTLSIDVDPHVQQDFDTYFNQATLAVGRTYGTQMQAKSVTLKISGYQAYELDFQTNDVKGYYIFTSANGSIYIFAFKGPAKQAVIQALQAELPDIYKSIQIASA